MYIHSIIESQVRNLFVILLNTGMRIGEALALKDTDIDYINNVIHVQRTIHRTDSGKWHEDTPKTRSSIRDIPLTDKAKGALKAQRYLQRDIISFHGYIFTDMMGRPIYRELVRQQIDTIVKHIREETDPTFPRITPHVFRDTFATRAIEAGMAPNTLKMILGHSSLAMTMDIYAHVMPDEKQDAMRQISAVFGKRKR